VAADISLISKLSLGGFYPAIADTSEKADNGRGGFRNDLLQLKDSLTSNLGLTFGSSGEGELTINGNHAAIYARKFKQKDGWKVVVCHGTR
jgi:hypothetical protein